MVGACGAPSSPQATSRADVAVVVPTPASAEPRGRATPRDVCYQGMSELVRTLSSPLRVRVFVHPNTGRVGAMATAIEAMLSRIDAPGKVKVSVVDASTELARREARELGLREAAIEDGGEPTLGYLGIAFEYGDEREVIPLLDPQQ